MTGRVLSCRYCGHDTENADAVCGPCRTVEGRGLSLSKWVREQAADFMRAWAKREYAPRTTCAECHFESSEGYPPSHAPGCSRGVDDA